MATRQAARQTATKPAHQPTAAGASDSASRKTRPSAGRKAPAPADAVRQPATPRTLDVLPDAEISLERFASDLLLEDSRWPNPQFAGERAEFAELNAVRIRGGQLSSTDWYRGTWVDVAADGVDLANGAFEESAWRRVFIDRCRLTGIVLSGCQLEDVTITGGVLDLANLRFATLNRVRLEDCVLTGSEFTSAELTDVTFANCDLAGAELSQVKCKRVHIVGCNLEGLRGVEYLRGAAVAPLDLTSLAMQLAAALGITVDWSEQA